MKNKNEIVLKFDYLDLLKEILEDIGMDVETATRMFFKKIVKERNVSFLFTNLEKADINKETLAIKNKSINRTEVNIIKMTKSLALSLFRQQGEVFNYDANVTFASKNKASNVYWSNPVYEYLNKDWYLILHDYNSKKLHLFVIPAKTIQHSSLVERNDQTDKIDLQILYGDPTFTDTRSGYSFLRFYKKSIQY